MNTEHIFSCYNTIKTKNKPFKALDTNSATDSQGGSKMTLKIKMAYFSIFTSGFRKII